MLRYAGEWNLVQLKVVLRNPKFYEKPLGISFLEAQFKETQNYFNSNVFRKSRAHCTNNNNEP